LLINRKDRKIPVYHQCELIGLGRSSYYYKPSNFRSDDLKVMNLIDEQYTKTPFYGIRRMTAVLRRLGYSINHKKVARLMRIMGLEAIYPRPRLSKSHKEHNKYPYLLKGMSIERPNQVWSSDITYIRLRHGFVYLVAIMDWFSRYVLSWSVSNTLDVYFCLEALEKALKINRPVIFNSDQGSQFTSDSFTGRLLENGVRISMDGRGRVYDNIFVERLWRTVKYEDVYLKDYSDMRDVKTGLRSYFEFYNNERIHQALDNRTPEEIYYNIDKRLNHTCFASQIHLMSRFVPTISSVLSQESLQCAPSGQTQEIIHLKKPLILS